MVSALLRLLRYKTELRSTVRFSLNSHGAPPFLRSTRRPPHFHARPTPLPPSIRHPIVLLPGLLWPRPWRSFAQHLDCGRGCALFRRLAGSSASHQQVDNLLRIVRTSPSSSTALPLSFIRAAQTHFPKFSLTFLLSTNLTFLPPLPHTRFTNPWVNLCA